MNILPWVLMNIILYFLLYYYVYVQNNYSEERNVRVGKLFKRLKIIARALSVIGVGYYFYDTHYHIYEKNYDSLGFSVMWAGLFLFGFMELLCKLVAVKSTE